MKVESIPECSPWSIMQYFWPALSDNWPWKPIFSLYLEWPFYTGFAEYQCTGAVGLYINYRGRFLTTQAILKCLYLSIGNSSILVPKIVLKFLNMTYHQRRLHWQARPIEDPRWLSFYINLTRKSFENACWIVWLCRASQHAFSKQSLVSLISKVAYLVLHEFFYPPIHSSDWWLWPENRFYFWRLAWGLLAGQYNQYKNLMHWLISL